MKLVWKCDFCCETNINKELMRTHEITCAFNPKNRACYSCKNFENIYDRNDCKKNLDYWLICDDGNCPSWETDDKKLLRKLKLEQINKLDKNG